MRQAASEAWMWIAGLCDSAVKVLDFRGIMQHFKRRTSQCHFTTFFPAKRLLDHFNADFQGYYKNLSLLRRMLNYSTATIHPPCADGDDSAYEQPSKLEHVNY